MEPAQFILPTMATLALGTALLVPLRDDRRGKRATVDGARPLRPDFRVIAGENGLPPHAELAQIADAPELPEEAPREHATVNAASGRDGTLNDGVPQHAADAPLSVNAADAPSAIPVRDDAAPETAFTLQRLWGRIRSRLPVARQRHREATALAPAFANELLPAGVSFEASDPGIVTTERSFADELDRLLSPAVTTHASPGPAGDAQREPSATLDVPETTATVVARLCESNARVVPLTRLPLRPQIGNVTWPEQLQPVRSGYTTAQRRELLTSFVRDPGSTTLDVLESAYAQEDRDGRLLALRALARGERHPRTRAIFIEALRRGTDEERALALDALVMHGERDDLVVALGDRVDAIAARAALAYVGCYERAAYRIALTPHVEPSRIEAILILLAGIVE